MLPVVKADIKADVTPTLHDASEGFGIVFKIVLGKKYLNSRLLEAQTDYDVEQIKQGKDDFRNNQLTEKKPLDIKRELISAIQDKQADNLLSCMRKAAECIEDKPEDSSDTISLKPLLIAGQMKQN